MHCQKCGKKLRSNEKFCTVCGYYNEFDNEGDNISLNDEFNTQLEDDIESFKKEEEEKDLEEFSSSFDMSEEDKKTFSREDMFLRAYIGEDYRVIKKSYFNIFAALLNWVYLLYRKMYITGILGLVTAGICIVYFKKIFPIYIVIVILLLGIFFNKIYITIAKGKIKKLEKKYEGSDDSSLEEIMEEKGGVNFVPAIIIYFIFILVVIVCMFPIHINKNNDTKFWKENSENKANCTYLVKETYKQLQKTGDSHNISEAACKIIKTTTTDYEVYLKDIYANVPNYYYYLISDSHITKKNDTKGIAALEEKDINNTITPEEKNKLIEMKNMKSNYQKIYEAAKKEDRLIRDKKNTKEKSNYIISQEILNR